MLTLENCQIMTDLAKPEVCGGENGSQFGGLGALRKEKRGCKV